MATRFYLPSSGASPLNSLPVSIEWESSGADFFRAPLLTAKSNSALADFVATFPNSTTQQMCWAQWVTDPMVSGYSFTPADTIKLVVRGLEGGLLVDGYLACMVRVVNGNGSVDRGTVDAWMGTNTVEFALSAATRIHNVSLAGAVNAQAGDRIVVEFGMYGATPSTAYNATLRFGDPSATADFALTHALTTDLCPWIELSPTLTFAPADALFAGGTIALAGSAALRSLGYVPMYAEGSIALAGSAALRACAPLSLTVAGSIALAGSADLSMATYLAATGSIALDGEAWLTTVLHGEDTLQAIGTIALRGTVVRLSTGETLPPTDNDRWTAPDAAIPDLRGLVVTVGGLSVKRAQMTDLVIELDIEGGPLSATLSVNCALTRAPRLMQTLVVTYKTQTLFRGRLENISSNVDASTGYTLTYAGPLITLRDHKAFRTVYVDSDLQCWQTDQGPRT